MNAYRVTWSTVCYWESVIEAESLEEATRLVEQGASVPSAAAEDENRRIGDYTDRADLCDEYDNGAVEVTLDEERTARIKVETPRK